MTKILEEDLKDFINLDIEEEPSDEAIKSHLAQQEQYELDAYDIEEDF